MYTGIAFIVLVIAIPFVVNLVKTGAWSSAKKRWVAIVFSVLGGFATLVVHIATTGAFDPGQIYLYALAGVGGVQSTYAIFKAAGATSKWLDALEGIGDKGEKIGGTD